MLIGLVLYHHVAPLPDKLKIQTQTQKITLHLGNTLYASSMQKNIPIEADKRDCAKQERKHKELEEIKIFECAMKHHRV
jgi:hypothetical protein